jgi:hypothetical protein
MKGKKTESHHRYVYKIVVFYVAFGFEIVQERETKIRIVQNFRCQFNEKYAADSAEQNLLFLVEVLFY